MTVWHLILSIFVEIDDISKKKLKKNWTADMEFYT